MRHLAIVTLMGLVASSFTQPARAQEARSVVIPGTPAQAAPAAPSKPAEEHLDLVGPTEAQKSRAKAAAEAQAKAAAEARAKAEAQAKAKVEAEARAKSEAEAKARAEAEAKARAEREKQIREEAARRAEVEAKARAEAEVKLRAEAEAKRKAALEAQVRADAEAKLRAETDAKRKTEIEAQVRLEVERRAREEAAARVEAEKKAAEAQASAAREEADRKARVEAEVKAKTAAEASLRAEIEARVRAQVEAELRARTEKESKAQAKAGAKARAEAEKKAKLEAKARAKEEARARRLAKKNGKKVPEALPLPEVPAAMIAEAPSKASETKVAAATPALATSPAAHPAEIAALKKADPALADVKLHDAPLTGPRVIVPTVAETRPQGTQVAMYTPGSPALVVAPGSGSDAASRSVAVPHDEDARPRRHAEVRDDIQVGPQSLLLNRLSANADLSPGMVSGTFAYRLVNDDAGAIHHTFQLGAGSPRTAEGEPERELRWFALGGLSPQSDNAYGVRRSIGGQNKTVADRLGWSGFTLGGGLTKAFPRPDGALEISGDAQLQGLSVGYVKNANQTTGQEAVDVSTKQLRLRGGGSYQSGRFTGLAQVAGFLYLGDGIEKLRGMPLRGAFVEDDLGGFASGPQSFELRVGGAVELTQTISASLRYAFVGYSQSDWASAHLVHAEGAARFGRVRAALGFTWQYDAPQITAPGASVGDYSSLYLTGSIGYAF